MKRLPIALKSKIATLTALWLLSASASWSRADDIKPVKVPFDTLKTEHIVVMVKINGKGPYRLIFDTGAPMTLVSNKVAKDSGVIDKDKNVAGLMMLGQMPQFPIKTLELGDLKATNLKTVVMDHPTVSLIDKALGPVEGIIGLTFFARYKMTIDYQAKEMTFVPVDFTPPDVINGLTALMTKGKADKKVLAPAGQWGLGVAKGANDNEAGVLVVNVVPGSSAATAGLKVGDRILTIESRWTDSVVDCFRAASLVRPGTAARVMVLREGKEMEVTVKVAAGV